MWGWGGGVRVGVHTRAHLHQAGALTYSPPPHPPPQDLPAPITDIERLASKGQRLLLCQPAPGSNVALGGLKVGVKKLFIRKVRGSWLLY